MSVRRFLLPAVLAAVAALSLPATAEAYPLPCPTVDGQGFCYDVSYTVHVPDGEVGDLTVGASVTVSNDCAAGGCPVPKSCISIPCLPLRLAFADRTVTVGRTGIDLADGTVWILGSPSPVVGYTIREPLA